jgi:3-hydroxybutyrate dehydrogenase
LEGATCGITANAICPGYVKTPLVEKQIADTALAHNISQERVEAEIMLIKQPVKKFVDIETLASMALLLADEKSGSITGASWTADGGWTAQ